MYQGDEDTKMDIQSGKTFGAIILALLCSWVVAQYLSLAIARMIGVSGPELSLVSFILYAVIFLLVLSGLQKLFGVFILDEKRL